jgi:SM-20-related protein
MKTYSEETYISWMDILADNDFVVIDDFLSDDLLDKLCQFFEERLNENDLEKAGIGALGNHTIDKKIRGDYIYWLSESRDIELNKLFNQLNEMVSKLKYYCFLSISDVECHLAYYPEGSFYKKHVDQFKERNNRIISFALYLNQDWKEENEGQLVIYKDGKSHKIDPIKNRIVIFKSAGLEHEVLLTNAPRYSVTGWMLNNPVGLGFL